MNRPASVTLLALLVLLIMCWNAVRLGMAIASWQVLAEYQARGGPLYVAISGAVWLVISAPLFAGLWQGKAWARKAFILASACYIAWYWFDRLFIQYPRANWPFALATSLILLSFSILILFKKGNISFFERGT